MIERKLTQHIQWIDIDNHILNETTVLEWRLFGKILLKRQTLNVTQFLPEGHKKQATPGFK